VIDPAVFARCERATLVFDLAEVERNMQRVASAARAVGLECDSLRGCSD